VLTGVAALDAEAAVRTGGWGRAMSRTATKEQDARARAREARLLLLADRNAQDERIEAAVAAALLAWQERSAARAQVEKAERAAGAGLRVLGREKFLVRDMAALTESNPWSVSGCCGCRSNPRTAHRPARGALLMPLGDAALAVLTTALRDPAVVTRRAKIASVPGGSMASRHCPGWTASGSARAMSSRHR